VLRPCVPARIGAGEVPRRELRLAGGARGCAPASRVNASGGAVARLGASGCPGVRTEGGVCSAGV